MYIFTQSRGAAALDTACAGGGCDTARNGCLFGGQAVILNLRLDTDETRILGAENHICELQLVLDPFLQVRARAHWLVLFRAITRR